MFISLEDSEMQAFSDRKQTCNVLEWRKRRITMCVNSLRMMKIFCLLKINNSKFDKSQDFSQTLSINSIVIIK